MSRIGVKPIPIPKSVKVNIGNNAVNVEGPKGKLQFVVPAQISVVVDADLVKVSRAQDTKQLRALHGLTRAMVANMVKGVSEGYSKELEIVGVGYRAQVTGKKIVLQLRFSHPIEYPIPEGINIEVPKPNQMVVKGIDRQKVGQVAADIRAFSPPEPYKGKGIRYVGEYVRRKAGKAVTKQ